MDTSHEGKLEGDELDVLQHLRRHLAGPLTGGFEIVEVEPSEGAWTIVDPVMRGGVHLILGADLDATALELMVTARFATGEIKRKLVFEPFSERETALPIIVPADGDLPAGMRIDLMMPNGVAPEVPLRVRHVKGTFAHLAFLGQLETARLRRSMRMLARHRLIAAAGGTLLDRIGAELSVPRLDTVLSFEQSVLHVDGGRETDTSYRERLAPYRQFILPTRAGLERELAMAGLGHAVSLEESGNPVEAVIRVIEVSLPGEGEVPTQQMPRRDAYMEAIKANVLIDPFTPLPERIRDASTAEREAQLHQRLAERLGDDLTEPVPMSPALAEALLRILDLTAALGLPCPFGEMRSLRTAGGTDDRLELGIGIDLALLPEVIGPLGAALANLPPGLSGPERRLAEMAAAKVKQGVEVFEAVATAAGIAVVLPADDGNIFVSTVHYGGIIATGPNLVNSLRQTYNAREPWSRWWLPVLQDVAAGLGVEATARRPEDLVNDAQSVSANLTVGADHLAEAGLAARTPQLLAASLANAQALQLGGILLSPAFSSGIGEGGEEDMLKLGTLLWRLADRGVPGAAVVPLRGGQTLVVVGPNGVPPLGANLSGRPRLDVRWYLVPLDGDALGAEARLIGRKAELVLPNLPNGLYGLMAVAHKRDGYADPYEVAVLPVEGQTLGFEQFERLVNLLARYRPAGVEINTWRLRKAAVRFDPEWPEYPPSVGNERSFRKYRLPRLSDWAQPTPET